MGEDEPSGDRAENSTITARSGIKQPEDGTERLKPYRWQKGQPSPNPGGRPKTLQITETLRAVGNMPLPDVARKKLERVVGPLPEEFTFTDGYALDEWLSVFGLSIGFRLDSAQDIRRATDGTEVHKAEIVEQPERDGAELRRHIYAGLIETAVKRSKLYNLPMPGLEHAAVEAGVDLEAVGKQLLTEDDE